MKSTIGIILFSSLINHAFSEDGYGALDANYYIVSDVFDKTIESGTFIVEGEVRMQSSGFPLPEVSIGMQALPAYSYSDSVGRFRIICQTQNDKSLYFFKEGWSEITIANYPFKDRHRITITSYLSQVSSNYIVRKPVIYLYSETDLNATIKLNPKGALTFTYPAYKEGWSVSVNSTDGITDLNSGKNYPYLFWEAKTSDLFYQSVDNKVPGFLIDTDSTIQFLENSLTSLGLNKTEQTDFITFWGPIIQKEKFALIQFLVDDTYESQIAGLDISPKPDAIRRVYILCSPVSDSGIGVEIIPQQFKKFERFGFTVVEWGGSEIDLTNLIPH